jgi:pimeloyl-ACP methyl ester carboxylesterase
LIQPAIAEHTRACSYDRAGLGFSDPPTRPSTSADQVRAAYRPLGDIPIIVLTHEAFPRGPAETQEQREAKNKLWIDLHDQIASMSTRGKRRTVDNAGHNIQMDQPRPVIDSILEVVRTSHGR